MDLVVLAVRMAVAVVDLSGRSIDLRHRRQVLFVGIHSAGQTRHFLRVVQRHFLRVVQMANDLQRLAGTMFHQRESIVAVQRRLKRWTQQQYALLV